MSTAASGIQHHSATVTATLVIGGDRIPLSKIGPERIYLTSPRHLAESEGIVEVTVDGVEQAWRVRLPGGAVPFDAAVEIESI
jgi:hypothetical protein